MEIVNDIVRYNPRGNCEIVLHKNDFQRNSRKLLLKYKHKFQKEEIHEARYILEDRYFIHRRKEEHHNIYSKLIVLSKWMVDMPEEDLNKWIMVPCPIGKRTRMAAIKGITEENYSTKRMFIRKLSSTLSGENPVLRRIGHYRLPICARKTSALCNGHSMTENRLHTLDRKIDEIEELKYDIDKNTHPILPLPRIKYNTDLEAVLRYLDPESHHLSGPLFYQKRSL